MIRDDRHFRFGRRRGRFGLMAQEAPGGGSSTSVQGGGAPRTSSPAPAPAPTGTATPAPPRTAEPAPTRPGGGLQIDIPTTPTAPRIAPSTWEPAAPAPTTPAGGGVFIPANLPSEPAPGTVWGSSIPRNVPIDLGPTSTPPTPVGVTPETAGATTTASQAAAAAAQLPSADSGGIPGAAGATSEPLPWSEGGGGGSAVTTGGQSALQAGIAGGLSAPILIVGGLVAFFLFGKRGRR